MNQPANLHICRLQGLWALTNRELRKWFKEPILLFMSVFQPLIWLGLFGKTINLTAILTGVLSISPSTVEQAMTRVFGTSDYFSFMAIGILSFLAYLTTLFSGISIVSDRRSGFLYKVLSTPVARSTIILSKVLSATARSIVEAAIVLIIALLLGLRLSPTFNFVNLLGMFTVTFLMCAGLSSLFLLAAIRSTKWETQAVIANLFSLPLMFASNALFPSSTLPGWLQIVAKINPITYAADALRQLLLYNLNVTKFLIDLVYLAVFAAVFVSISMTLSQKYLTK